jgi:hypothetical protein
VLDTHRTAWPGRVSVVPGGDHWPAPPGLAVTQASRRKGSSSGILLVDSHASARIRSFSTALALFEALGKETLSRAELAARTGLNDQTVRRWLKIMREEGTIEVAGDSPKSMHVRYRRTNQAQLFPPEEPGRI